MAADPAERPELADRTGLRAGFRGGVLPGEALRRPRSARALLRTERVRVVLLAAWRRAGYDPGAARHVGAARHCDVVGRARFRCDADLGVSARNAHGRSVAVLG